MFAKAIRKYMDIKIVKIKHESKDMTMRGFASFNDIPRMNKVLVDSLVVDDGPHHHVDVPDGVGQRYEAV